MNRYGYQLKQNTEPKKSNIRYRRADLELMTTFQLREICMREKIVQGMDKEELIHTILHYRGADEYFLIQQQNGVGRKEFFDLWNQQCDDMCGMIDFAHQHNIIAAILVTEASKFGSV